MKMLTPNARRRLQWVVKQYGRSPDPEIRVKVPTRTADAAIYVMGFEWQPKVTSLARTMMHHVLEDRYVQALADLDRLIALLPEKHRDDFMIPWMAKQFNDMMKSRNKEQASRVMLVGQEESYWNEARGAWLFDMSRQLKSHGAAIAQWVREERVDLNKYTLQQALEVIHDREAELDEVPQGEVVYEWRDGWTVQQLGPECLDAEGEIMQHCVGSGGYDEAVAEGHSVIYSLRDPGGRPHATMEVSAKTGRFVQIQGKQNEPPVEKYLVRIREFINESMGGEPLGLWMAGVKDGRSGPARRGLG